MDSNLIYAIMYLEINLLAVAIIAFIHYKTSGLTKMVAQRNFTMAIDAEMMFFLSDLFYVMIKCGIFPKSVFLMMLFKEIYFLSTSVLCFFWFVYFEYFQDSPFVKNRRNVLLSSVLVWIMLILLIINIFNGMFFRVDKDGSYERGPLFILQYLLSYIYVFFTCGRALIRSFNKQYILQRKTLFKLAMFPLAPATAGIIQFVAPEIPIACVTLAFATLVIYVDWTEQMISADPLTHLHNRKMLEFYYEQWRNNAENASLYLLMVDADKFKQINDNYGHVQGDLALIRIAEAMRVALRGHSRRFNIARYGGDEFAILLWAENDREVESIRSRINSVLQALNEEANAPYKLTVSIGYHKASSDMKLKELIEHADEVLYRQKRKA